MTPVIEGGPPPAAPIESTVRGCARCGLDHPGVVFREFKRPVRFNAETLITHWAECPMNGDPILMHKAPAPTSDRLD